MNVPFLDLGRRPEALRKIDLLAIQGVLDSGVSILGPEVENFENQWALEAGCPAAVGVGNGLDALEIALRTLDLGEDAEVVVPSVSAAATVLAVLRAGLKPVFADVDPQTGLMCMESAEIAVGPRTRALIVVHLYGRLDRPDQWVGFCRDRGLALVEDCAQAHQASWNGQRAGSFGQVAAFSFYPTKNLGALGDAGAVTSSDIGLIRRAQELRDYGQAERYEHHRVGLNSRLDELQAAVLSARLQHLGQETSRRREIAQFYYDNLLHADLSLLERPKEPESHVYHLFIVRANKRSGFRSALLRQGVQTDIHYPRALHQQIAFESVAHSPGGLAQAERFAEVCLSLPCNPWMHDHEVEKVVESVNKLRVH